MLRKTKVSIILHVQFTIRLRGTQTLKLPIILQFFTYFIFTRGLFRSFIYAIVNPSCIVLLIALVTSTDFLLASSGKVVQEETTVGPSWNLLVIALLLLRANRSSANRKHAFYYLHRKVSIFKGPQSARVAFDHVLRKHDKQCPRWPLISIQI